MIKQALSATLGRASNAFNEFAAARLPSNRLTGQDALFLHLDQPHAATHGSMIYIYDQSTVPGKKLKFQDVLRHVQERLSSSPLSRTRISTSTFTSVTSRCPSPTTGASSASSPRASTRARWT